MTMTQFKYRLTVRIEIEKMFNAGSTGERLSVSEELFLPPMKFLEACMVLGKFEELAQSFKTEDV